MPNFKTTELQDKNNLILRYESTTEGQVSEWIDDHIKQAGYILKSGTPNNGSYEKGNRTARILLGAFVKYFKFNTTIDGTGGAGVVRLTITKATSGMSGGAIGIGQVKTEFERIAKELRSL